MHIAVIREALGHEGVSVRFAQEGQLVATHVAEPTFEFMPAHPDFPIDGENAVAEVYRTGEALVIEDLEASELEPTRDYGDLRSVVVVARGDHGTFAVASPEQAAIDEFDTHLIEGFARYAALILDRLEREETLTGILNLSKLHAGQMRWGNPAHAMHGNGLRGINGRGKTAKKKTPPDRPFKPSEGV